MNHEALGKLSITALKARILREWQKASCGRSEEFGERERLCLELINDFPYATEKTVCRVFGVHYSSAAHLINKLTGMQLLEKIGKRGERLKLTKTGVDMVEELRLSNAARMKRWFSALEPSDWAALDRIAAKLDRAVTDQILELIFDSPTGVGDASLRTRK
jgi:Mn-dependent DtxR family transcriptional regulator